MQAERPDPPARPSRSEARNEAARAALVPLREGERPRAVTAGALVLGAFAALNVVWFLTGRRIGGHHDPRALAYSVLTGFVAVGMWRVSYWAVVLMQALLTLVIVFFSLIALKASNLPTAGLCLAFVVAAGTLFWFLVKAMARIQMPEREPR